MNKLYANVAFCVMLNICTYSYIRMYVMQIVLLMLHKMVYYMHICYANVAFYVM